MPLFAEEAMGLNASAIGTWVLITALVLNAVSHLRSFLPKEKNEDEKPATKKELEALRNSLLVFVTKAELQHFEIQIQSMLNDSKENNRNLNTRLDSMGKDYADLRLAIERQHNQIRDDINKVMQETGARMEAQNVRITTTELGIAGMKERLTANELSMANVKDRLSKRARREESDKPAAS